MENMLLFTTNGFFFFLRYSFNHLKDILFSLFFFVKQAFLCNSEFLKISIYLLNISYVFSLHACFFPLIKLQRVKNDRQTNGNEINQETIFFQLLRNNSVLNFWMNFQKAVIFNISTLVSHMTRDSWLRLKTKP